MNKQSTSISITRFAFARELPDFFSDVHATFKPGSLTILYGPNGVGKSTLLRLIQARVYPGEIVSGKLTLADTQYTLGTMYEHLPIRLVQQNIQSMIADQFTGYENLQLALLPRAPGLAPLATPAVKHRAFELPLDKPVYQLSGGQKQLLAILMLLQKPTELLLLDEPTAALDPQRSTQLMQFLKTVAHERDIPVVMISHDQEITSYADAIYELRIESDNVRRLNLVVA